MTLVTVFETEEDCTFSDFPADLFIAKPRQAKQSINNESIIFIFIPVRFSFNCFAKVVY